MSAELTWISYVHFVINLRLKIHVNYMVHKCKLFVLLYNVNIICYYFQNIKISQKYININRIILLLLKH